MTDDTSHGLPRLTTPRLVLRALELSDLDLALALGTDPEVMRYVGPVMTPEQAKIDLVDLTRRGPGDALGVWCVTDRETSEKLGTVFLLPLPIDATDTEWHRVDPAVPVCGPTEVGYLLRRTAWGRGIATEACRRLIRHAFESTPHEEIVAVLDAKNVASRRVLEKSGLRSTGPRRAFGETCPGFALTKAQWQADQAGAVANP